VGLFANGTGRDREGGAGVPRRQMNAGGVLRHGEQGDAGMGSLGYLPCQHGTGVVACSCCLLSFIVLLSCERTCQSPGLLDMKLHSCVPCVSAPVTSHGF
jgi:hypothetical protein